MKNHSNTARAFSVVMACGLLAGCATHGATSGTSTSPLVGKYQSQGGIAIFSADGTYRGTALDGKEWVKGTYKVDGNSFTMIDTWEDQAVIQPSCIGVPGRYTWELKDDALTAQAVEDTCEGRKQATNNTTWKRVP